MNDTEQVAMSMEVMRFRVETAAEYHREYPSFSRSV